MAKELCFTPSISIEEIEENFKDFDFFGTFYESLNDALAYKQGRANKGTIIHSFEEDGSITEKLFWK